LSCQEDTREEEVIRRDGKIEVQFDHIIAIAEERYGSTQILRCVVLPIGALDKRESRCDLAGEVDYAPSYGDD